MKIVYVYDAIARIGGTERILADKMNYLADVYGYEIYFISSDQGNHPFSFPLSPRITHIDLKIQQYQQYYFTYPKRLIVRIKKNILFRKNLNKAIQEINPDIVCCTTYYKADIVCLLKCKAKKIVESHCATSHLFSKDPYNQTFITKWWHKWETIRYKYIIEKNCDAVVVLTQHDATHWKRVPKVYIIPNMVHNTCTPYNFSIERRAVSAGRLVHGKGYDRLIEVWADVQKKHPDWKLDIFGEGILHKDLSKKITEKKLEKVIKLNPYTTELDKEYLHSSLYIMASRFEGFGLVLIEAMRCGVPCIAFDCPYGPRDIIKNKTNGLLIKDGDIKGMSDAICYLIENKDIRKKMANAAKENVKRFFPEKIMPHWNDIFFELKNF